jgi:hypothetical protein
MDRGEVSALWSQYLALHDELYNLEAVHPLAKQFRNGVVAAAKAAKPRRKIAIEFREACEIIGDDAVDKIRAPLRDDAEEVFKDLKELTDAAEVQSDRALADLEILPGDWRYVDGSHVEATARDMAKAIESRGVTVECRWFEPDKDWRVHARLADDLDVAAARVVVSRDTR